MKRIFERFWIWYRMRTIHHWEKIGHASIKVARALGEEYQPEQPKKKAGDILPSEPPIVGECYFYEDDEIRLDVKLAFNLVMFRDIPDVRIYARKGDGWMAVFGCGMMECWRYQFGDWVEVLFALERDLVSKEKRAQKAQFEPIKHGGFIDPDESLYVDESPYKHQEKILPTNGPYVARRKP